MVIVEKKVSVLQVPKPVARLVCPLCGRAFLPDAKTEAGQHVDACFALGRITSESQYAYGEGTVTVIGIESGIVSYYKDVKIGQGSRTSGLRQVSMQLFRELLLEGKGL